MFDVILLQMMTQAQGQHRDLIQSIEGLPAAPGLSPLDQDLLMLKATSMATMNCLNECLHILHLQQVARHRSSLGGQWRSLPLSQVSYHHKHLPRNHLLCAIA